MVAMEEEAAATEKGEQQHDKQGTESDGLYIIVRQHVQYHGMIYEGVLECGRSIIMYL